MLYRQHLLVQLPHAGYVHWLFGHLPEGAPHVQVGNEKLVMISERKRCTPQDNCCGTCLVKKIDWPQHAALSCSQSVPGWCKLSHHVAMRAVTWLVHNAIDHCLALNFQDYWLL